MLGQLRPQQTTRTLTVNQPASHQVTAPLAQPTSTRSRTAPHPPCRVCARSADQLDSAVGGPIAQFCVLASQSCRIEPCDRSHHHFLRLLGACDHEWFNRAPPPGRKQHPYRDLLEVLRERQGDGVRFAGDPLNSAHLQSGRTASPACQEPAEDLRPDLLRAA